MAAEPDFVELLRRERERTALEITELSDEFDAIVAAAENANGDDEHDPEGATVGFERARVRALLDRAIEHLAEVEAATSRLATDGFGRCTRCDSAIGVERLTAIPTATLCIRCAAGADAPPRID